MKRLIYLNIYVIAISIIIVILTSKNALALTNFLPWQQNTSLPYTIASHVSFTNSGKIYELGGSGNEGVARSEVIQADINNNGVLSRWTTISNLPKPIIWHSIAKSNQRVYVLGGFSGDVIDQNNFDTVYEASINPDGSLGPWNSLTPLPIQSAMGSAVVIGNYLYYAGGNLVPHQASDLNYATSSIYKTDVNPVDGTIGNWSIVGNLPNKMLGFEMMGLNDYLYIFGGNTPSGVVSSVMRAPVYLNGSIGTWQNLSPFPQEIWRFGLAHINNILITTGGGTSTTITDKVYYSTINEDGSITPWQISPNNLPDINCCSPLVSWGNFLYLTGGHDGNNYFNNVYSATVEDIIPTPDPTPTASPTPTSHPVSKVFFAPGLGGSWNVDAIINCRLDNYSGNWTLAPYAKETYQPILETLATYGWNTIPFYYDWRQLVAQNADQLADYIDTNTDLDEKINLVGHSMGGLVGRGYLDAASGGKLSSFLTVGTPHKGSALAYPPWEGGDVWNDNFIEKIALTLYLKHCGEIKSNDKETIQKKVPSLRDLLPIEPYLQKTKTTNLYLPSHPENQNLWLNNLSSKSWGVRLGYIAGSGFNTLKIIHVKDPNKIESKLGNWEDGKPIGKSFSAEGDGTVLASSAILPQANFSATLNQNHRELVTSAEGMAKILEFLGKPPSIIQSHLVVDSVEPNSALIVISYPADFSVLDQDGKNKIGKNGMVSYINPKTGIYKLNLFPKSNSTLVIIAQFLPNGEIKYKEYNFKGFGPKSTTLKFSQQNPQEDILNP